MDMVAENPEIELLRRQLQDAKDTIEAIRRGEVDALVIKGNNGNEVYTLESADRTYRVFLEKMSEGAVTLNGTGIIQYSNSSFASMINLTPALIVAELFEDLVCVEDRKYFIDLLEKGWKTDIKGEVSLIRNNGYTPVQLSITALRLGKDFTLSILITDLTKQKEAQLLLKLKNEELEASNLALELSNTDLMQFAYVASHDLQEPLRKILIFSASLKGKLEHEHLDMSAMTLIDKVIRSATRMRILIVDILAYSRLSQKQNNFEATDLKLLIQELLEDLEMAIEEKKAIIIIENMPIIPAIKSQIRQVFQNLIGNALKFAKKNETSRIEIFATSEFEGFPETEKLPEKFCHIHVKDNGIGFDQKYAQTVFHLFEKLNPKVDYEGTGIGLAICKKIMEKHLGHIYAKSIVGIGSEFIISLPIIQDPI
jgi:two-component system CheB/CheR fusion protein